MKADEQGCSLDKLTHLYANLFFTTGFFTYQLGETSVKTTS